MRGRATLFEKKVATRLIPADFLARVLRQGAFFAAGLLMARAQVFGSYSPFAIALVAAAPYQNMALALLGGVAGAFLTGFSTGGMRYLAALVAAAAIRWTFKELKKVTAHPLFAPLAALIPVLATGLTIGRLGAFAQQPLIMIFSESLLAAGAAYFIARTSAALDSSSGLAGLDTQGLASLAITGGILLLSLSSLSIAGVSLGRVCAVLVILFCAQQGGVVGGGICGTACGMVFGLAGGPVGALSGAYAFAGLTAGFFSKIGKLGTAAAFILSNAIAAVALGSDGAILTGLYETAAATIVFMLLPFDRMGRLTRLFARPGEQTAAEGMQRSAAMRLDFAAKAISQVTASVEEVSKKLLKKSASSVTGVYDNAINETCKNCGLRLFCWEKNFEPSMQAFNSLTPILRRKGQVAKSDFPPAFAAHCTRINRLAGTVTGYYEDFIGNQSAERRVAEIRAAVKSQFSGVSEMLGELAEELREEQRFDQQAARLVAEMLTSSGIVPEEVVCRIDGAGRMTVEISAALAEHAKLNKAALAKEVSRVCGRHFAAPCIAAADGACRITLTERAAFGLILGFSQHICKGNSLCGDHYESLQDARGRTVVVLSDGMGSGGRAAVDSAMASGLLGKLVEAGIGFDCALRIVNSALYIKSGDETLATLDVVRFDHCTGTAEFFKAGAPAAYVRQGRQVSRVDLGSLPAGILQDVRFAKGNASLQPGDWVVLISDGAAANGDRWIMDLLEKWDGSAQELSDRIVESASTRRDDGHDDDITAIAAFVTRTA